MATDTPRRPLWNNQYAWLSSKKDGTLRVVFGPDALETTDDDQWLAKDLQDSTKVRVVTGPIEAISDFITLLPGKFAILTNHAVPIDNHPNGAWGKGRRELANLSFGTKRVIASGHFPLWPGQAVTVKDVYRLSPSEYLIVQVVSDKVDETSPYYDVTVKCAADIAAVVDDKGEVAKGATGQSDSSSPPTTPSPVDAKKFSEVFQVGQRIRISGTPTYIPPTGVEVVPDPAGRETRQALVLGPTEFCSLIDRDGQPQRKSGPGRVFPGPYDLVQTLGSRNNGVYDAYHLRDDRGLLISVVADNIPKDELQKQLPFGVVLEQENYRKCDEVFIKGISAYLIPGNAIEVINPESRLPQVGNDHGNVFVKAIGVDQKSGIYVADVKTGNVDLLRGEKSEVLDPRHKKQMMRRVPAHLWNLIIGWGEPHKKVDEGEESKEGESSVPVETPWALSITVPNNEAVLITSRSGRRCVVGPCSELLLYDETLQVLRLSRGKPKSDDKVKETCFLRVDGNSVSDRILLQTKDYVTIEVDVSYGVRFIGKSPEERASWFNYTNYVQFFCDHLRSVLRAKARKLTLSELAEGVAEFVRDTVLGVKPQDGHRPGTQFNENSMLVYEVEVLNWVIPDKSVAEKISQTNRNVVTRQFEDADKRNQLQSQQVQAETDAQIKQLKRKMLELEKDLQLAQAEANDKVAVRTHELAITLQERQHQDQMALEKKRADLADELSKRTLLREEAVANQKNDLLANEHAVAEAHAKAEAELNLQNVKALAEADAERFKAVQPGLIEAITGASNANLAGKLAEHLPEAGGGWHAQHVVGRWRNGRSASFRERLTDG